MLANRIGRLAPALLLLASLGCGGETVVSGFGNNGNVFGVDVLGRVADELAKSPSVPAVSDDDLRAVFSAIREDALEGDPKAALVLLLVAGEQREPKD
jgi:hypothetical protein